MKNIEFPEHWQAPKYKLGQHVKQGQIIGMEYRAPGTRLSYMYGEGWSYWVLADLMGDAEDIDESDIELATAKELRSVVEEQQALIEAYQQNVVALNEQAKEH
jgi:hypothetical protein